MKYKTILLISILLTTLALANDTKLIEEQEINKWGYTTISFENKISNGVEKKEQIIKSKKEAPGMENTYFYYSLSEQCFGDIFSAIKNKMGLLFRGEKDYLLSELTGKCVRVIDTSASFSAFNERTRIFSLFNKYLNNESHNKSAKTAAQKSRSSDS